MFRIRRIFDDTLPDNQRVIADVQAILKAQFPGVAAEEIAALPSKLRDPLASRLRAVLIVAENGNRVEGFATILHAPDLGFVYLDFVSSAPGKTGRGIGGALYERVRDEAKRLGAIGLFFECLPDEASQVSPEGDLEKNRARLRFYERYGARPLDGTDYQRPLEPGQLDMPLLVMDDLGTGRALRRNEARAVIRAICERKYAGLCPPEYVEAVVASVKDDPVRLRPPRYGRHAPRPVPTTLPEDARVALFVAEQHDIHHVRERGYVESPVRIRSILDALEPTELFVRKAAPTAPLADIHAVHDVDFVRYLERVCTALPEGRSVYPYVFPIRNATRPPEDLETCAGYYCIDTFTPLHRNAFRAARGAVDCAVAGAKELHRGRRFAYALVRPPGHHAERRTFGGFCYLNAAAVAAQWLTRDGRVAILDVDYHHGNGQQEIFYERSDVLTVSIHGHPRFAYPYFSGFDDERGRDAGVGFNLNLPLPEKLDGAGHRRALKTALQAIRTFQPTTLVVCLGLDTAKGDPTGTWDLAPEDFEENGRLIGELGLPTLVVQEGGYRAARLGAYATRFFRGLTNR